MDYLVVLYKSGPVLGRALVCVCMYVCRRTISVRTPVGLAFWHVNAGRNIASCIHQAVEKSAYLTLL